MAIFLDEDEVGADANMVGYPHLLLCMGVTVVMGDGSLIGAHVSSKSSEAAVLNGLLHAIQQHGGPMDQLYCCANMAEHLTHHGCMDIMGKANAIGFHGQGYSFDFGFLNPRDGAYVELTSNGAGALCTVRYKRNEKVKYTRPQGGGGMVTKSSLDFYGRPKSYQKSSVVTAVRGKSKLFGRHHISTAGVTMLTPSTIP